jgi:RNA polymerase sigma-70 factor (ECF subfamily)
VPLRPQETAGDDGNSAKRKEEKAFDFFFREYYSALCFFAHSIIQDREEAKDLVQDCFLKLWEGHMINERSETVKSFLYTMVRNKCLDYLRKKKIISKAKKRLTNENAEFEYFDEVAFAETVRQVMSHINELPLKVQQIFKLHYVESKRHQEIAKEINSTPDAIEKQKNRALKSIRQKLLLVFTFISYFL